MNKIIVILATFALVFAPPIFGDTIQDSGSIGVAVTTNTGTITLQQFDPSLGTLNFVDIFLQGDVTGDIAFENKDSNGQNITARLSSVIKLFNPLDGSELVQTIPVAEEVVNVTGFDGTEDFGGSSGASFNDLTATNNNSKRLVPSFGDDVSSFVGTGLVNLDFEAKGASVVEAGGNVISQISTLAGGTATVVYNFTPDDPDPNPVPEPSSLLLLGMGGLIGVVLRFRKK